MKVCLLIFITIVIKNCINASNIDPSKCLTTKVFCQSVPAKCVQNNEECHSLLIATPVINNNVETDVQFELFGKIDANRHYFAMGLSLDRQMGNDSVTEIYVSNDGTYHMRQSWNDGKHNQVINEVNSIKQIGDVVNTDGILSGKWMRKAVTEVHSNRFDMTNTKYNILLANGAIDSNNSKQQINQFFFFFETVLPLIDRKFISRFYFEILPVFHPIFYFYRKK